jgi:protein-disulfide isomerase
VNDTITAPQARGTLGPAIAGGLVGSLLTAALLLFAVPQLLSERIVREGMLRDPAILTDTVDALREGQVAPVLDANRAALETPFGSSWKGAAKPDVTLVEFYDFDCGFCKSSNPVIARLLEEDKGLRVVYRELPILGPESVAASRLALHASKAGRFNQFHDALWAAGPLSANSIAKAMAATRLAPTAESDRQIEAELQQNRKLAGELGGTGTPVFVVGNRVMNGAVGYDALKEAIAAAREKA